MSLKERLAELVRACFAGLWIESFEHEDALVEIAGLCREQDWQLATWDIERGLSLAGAAEAAVPAGDPLSAVRALSALGEPSKPTLLVLVNFHRFLGSPEIVQAVARQIAAGKQERRFLLILAPTVQLPPELEKQFVVVEHALPSREQLLEIARGVATEEGELPIGPELERVLDAAAGLTRYEAEGAFSLALVRHGRLEPATIWELKSQLLKKSGLVSLYRGEASFAELGGLAPLKTFCLKAMAARSGRVRPRGVLLLSPPGCGKSQFAKALGHETGRPTLILDVGALMGSLVGQTEQNIRQALQIADAMAPCILFCDEIEKALSGLAASGQTDSGVSARLFGTLLTWLNDHASDVFFVGTCNDISKLPPEFSRAERFDGVFFLDLPEPQQRQAIWQLYQQLFALPEGQALPKDQDWTGAEIRACCRLAALLELPLVEAARHVVPVAVTAAEAVEWLRNWADGRCLSADREGIYRRQVRTLIKPGPRARRDPSNN